MQRGWSARVFSGWLSVCVFFSFQLGPFFLLSAFVLAVVTCTCTFGGVHVGPRHHPVLALHSWAAVGGWDGRGGGRSCRRFAPVCCSPFLICASRDIALASGCPSNQPVAVGFAGRGGGRTIHAWPCLLLVGWLVAGGSWVGFATICAGAQLEVRDGNSQCLVVAGLMNQLPNVTGIDCSVRLPLFPPRRGRVMGGGGSILRTAHMRLPPEGWLPLPLRVTGVRQVCCSLHNKMPSLFMSGRRGEGKCRGCDTAKRN